MLTSDGAEIDWPYSSCAMTTCSEATVRALREGDYASRALAHAGLTWGQCHTLYRDRGKWQARVLRCMGRRIAETGVYEYARGVPEKKLVGIFIGRRFAELKDDRRALIEALLQVS